MLKIKDGVELEELKKFGFIYEERVIYTQYAFRNEDCCIYIDCADRVLSMTDREYDTIYLVPDVIYDLIEAGLVVNEAIDSNE